MADQARSKPAPYRWGFASALAAVLVLVVTGHAIGVLAERFPPTLALIQLLRNDRAAASAAWDLVPSGMVARDWLFSAFLVCAVVYAVLQRAAWLRFFRTMQVGVSLITLITVSVGIGVLVPQIDNFEDPDQVVSESNWKSEFERFAWSEGYFLYHVMHLYGIGMPQAEIPPAAEEGLERFGRVYGELEAANRAKMMEAALSGQVKTDEITSFIQDNRSAFETAFRVCTALDLNRTYKSHWFASLLGLLFCAVWSNTFRGNLRRCFTVQRIGFFTTHLGIMTLIVGGVVSNRTSDRGILQLYLGKPAEDTYYRHYREDRFAKLPFGLRVDHFARKEWKAIEVHFLGQDFKSRVPRYTVWPGRKVPLDFEQDAEGEWQPKVELRVRAVHDHAVVALPKVREGESGDGGGQLPLAEIEVPAAAHASEEHAHDFGEQEGETERHYLSPQLEDRIYIDPTGAFRLAPLYAGDPQSRFPRGDDASFAILDIEVLGSGQDAPQALRVELGRRYELPRGYSVEVVAATRDFKTGRDTKEQNFDTRPLEEQSDGFRAVWIDLHPPAGREPERRLVLEAMDPVEYGLQQDYAHRDVIARLRWDRWREPGAPRFVLGWGAEGGGTLYGEDGVSRPVELDRELDLPGEARVVVRAFYRRARFEKNIRFLPKPVSDGGWDSSFYQRDARGLELDVVHEPGTEKEVVESVQMASSEQGQANVWYSGDERFAVVFLENTDGFPFDWRSVLSVVETDAEGQPYVVDTGREAEREIRVNDYFEHRGWRFFQTNADPSLPTYSGIGVVWDPGIPIVLTGMYTIILGTLLAFILRPILLRQRSLP